MTAVIFTVNLDVTTKLYLILMQLSRLIQIMVMLSITEVLSIYRWKIIARLRLTINLLWSLCLMTWSPCLIWHIAITKTIKLTKLKKSTNTLSIFLTIKRRRSWWRYSKIRKNFWNLSKGLLNNIEKGSDKSMRWIGSVLKAKEKISKMGSKN